MITEGRWLANPIIGVWEDLLFDDACQQLLLVHMWRLCPCWDPWDSEWVLTSPREDTRETDSCGIETVAGISLGEKVWSLSGFCKALFPDILTAHNLLLSRLTRTFWLQRFLTVNLSGSRLSLWKRAKIKQLRYDVKTLKGEMWNNNTLMSMPFSEHLKSVQIL